MPDRIAADGDTLTLNGLALRTYSIFRIRIYVGGLYLKAPTHDAEAVLHENEPRVIALKFLHDVPVDKSRSVWRQNIEQVCSDRCMPTESSLNMFLQHLREIKSGDQVDFIFTDKGLDTAVNGVPSGKVNDATLENAILEVFIGTKAPTPSVRRGLMGS